MDDNLITQHAEFLINSADTIAKFFSLKSRVLQGYIKEILNSKERYRFYERVDYFKVEGGMKCPELLYVICRIVKPKVVIETGVANGFSTFFLLSSLNKNKFGTLWSIDKPNYTDVVADSNPEYKKRIGPRSGDRIAETKMSGWLVPEELQQRWRLIISTTREILPSLLYTVQPVDIFIHDSEHTYEGMTYEFEQVWPFIKSRGLLMADDIDWNTAFNDFTSNKKDNSLVIENRLGIIKKLTL